MRVFYAIFLVIIISVTACDQPANAPQDEVIGTKDSEVRLSKEKVELEFWSHYPGWESIAAAFEKKYPNVTVNIKTSTYETYVDKYEQALADGRAPDILIVDSEHFGRFASIQGLENLLDHGAGKYRDDFSSSLWDINYSFDGKSLIGFPSGSSPLITYYRADIMEKFGFPSDPEELGTYMEDSNNWLKIARTLKAEESYITEWPMDVVQIFESTVGLYTEDMKFARNNKTFENALEIASTVYNEGLTSSTDTWTKSGAEALNNGKVAMLYMGTWGASQLEQWAPDTTGLWRQTRLPFNVYGWANSSSFMIPSSSKNKDWAFAFIEFCVTVYSLNGAGNSVPSYLPARSNEERLSKGSPFFGGQRLYNINEMLANRMVETRLTPIDGQTKTIWAKVLNQGIDRKKSADLILDEAQQEIFNSLNEEINILRNYLESVQKAEVSEQP
ncbi:ABC transporter substrate-binding protein [Paenibacillus sp. L3-i20]|uniref:ABC transporter substrate-binding protein n=1 Tax=Paenibacillus sp. L3-i20 TaxID=2905833 RepID=UPI001EDD4D1C|nr:extracellular solute-binding protein [Paenibacillus sp. L3-i20]GKU78104.1 sugar ABC transporter substrate-binding protein [Paenibacillus sp. L3-i20]